MPESSTPARVLPVSGARGGIGAPGAGPAPVPAASEAVGPVGVAVGAAGPEGTESPLAGAIAMRAPSPVAAEAGAGAVPVMPAEPVRSDGLPAAASGFGDVAGGRSAAAGGPDAAVVSIPVDPLAPAPDPAVAPVGAGAAAVSVAAGVSVGGGASKIHTASAHSTVPRMRSLIPESRVMMSWFATGPGAGGHDSPIGG